MEENSREIRRKMRNQILGCYWAVNAESLENKGIPRFSFRFESTSAHQRRIIRTTFLSRVNGSDLLLLSPMRNHKETAVIHTKDSRHFAYIKVKRAYNLIRFSK